MSVLIFIACTLLGYTMAQPVIGALRTYAANQAYNARMRKRWAGCKATQKLLAR